MEISKVKERAFDPIPSLFFLILSILTSQIIQSPASHAQVRDMIANSPILRGKTGVATTADLDSIWLNPAQVARFDENQIGATWGVQLYDYTYRFPGFSAVKKSKTSLNPAIPVPNFVYKLSKKLGISGLVIPFSVSQDIKGSDLPLIILGQQAQVDLSAKGQLEFFLESTLGYEFNSNSWGGFSLHYSKFSAQGDLVPSGSGPPPIASFSLSQSTFQLGLGGITKFSKFSFGLSGVLVSQAKVVSSFTSLTDDKANSPSDESKSDYLNPIRFGLASHHIIRTELSLDIEYKRKSSKPTRNSIKEFKTKALDEYDTLSVFAGSVFRSSNQLHILSGAFYEPSSIGAGEASENGKTGFGFMDLAMSLGQPPSRPRWGVAFGIRNLRMPAVFYDDNSDLQSRRGYKGDDEKSKVYRLTVESGIVYSETSIGVDNKGEQPGAYLVKRFEIPIKLSYKF
jgi:hypothetical protein